MKTSNLQGWYVKRVNRSDIKEFIEKWHYSQSINGCKASFCYALYNETDEMMGALFYGGMAMANQWKKFGEQENDVIELRRLCCVNDTPKNAESFFIGWSLRELRKDWGGKIVVSYADKEYGHEGIIYKASNWEMTGETKGAKVIIYGEKRYHDKTIRTKYKGKLKPYAQRIKDALECNEAYYKNTKGKYTYTYKL
jgi:hypothetical protein